MTQLRNGIITHSLVVDGVTLPELGDRADIRVVTAAFVEVLKRVLPRGGTTGQVLGKTSADDFAVSWLPGFSDLAVYTRQGVVANPSTASATFVDIPDLSAAIFLAVTASVSAWVTVTVTHATAAADVAVALRMDAGVDDGPISTRVNVAGGQTSITAHWAWPEMTPGLHTVTGRWRTSAGSVTAVETLRTLLVQHVQLYVRGGVIWDEHVPGGPSDWTDVSGGWS